MTLGGCWPASYATWMRRPRVDGVPMLPQEIIRRKRDGAALSEAEIDAIVAGITDGALADTQVGAFAMTAPSDAW